MGNKFFLPELKIMTAIDVWAQPLHGRALQNLPGEKWVIVHFVEIRSLFERSGASAFLKMADENPGR